jgi:hypothetical protein
LPRDSHVQSHAAVHKNKLCDSHAPLVARAIAGGWTRPRSGQSRATASAKSISSRCPDIPSRSIQPTRGYHFYPIWRLMLSPNPALRLLDERLSCTTPTLVSCLWELRHLSHRVARGRIRLQGCLVLQLCETRALPVSDLSASAVRADMSGPARLAPGHTPVPQPYAINSLPPRCLSPQRLRRQRERYPDRNLLVIWLRSMLGQKNLALDTAALVRGEKGNQSCTSITALPHGSKSPVLVYCML